MYKFITASLAVVGTLGLVERAYAKPITLDIALQRAARRPSVEGARLGIDEARANARGAALPLYNPELSGGAGPQFGHGSRSLQAQIALQQTIELGGKRSARTRLADTLTHGAEITNRAELHRARVETWQAFERALVLRDRLETRRQVETLALALATAMQKSAAAGGATKLRVNLVTADAGRATQERIAAENEYAVARASLATAIGAGPQEALDPTGAVADPPALGKSLDALVAGALREHPEIQAGDNVVAEANARVADADARGVPDVTLGIGYEYAPDPDGANAIVGTLTFPLPIRNRNQGERAAARVAVKRAEVERRYVRTEVERAIRLAVENLDRARSAVAAFDREVSERLNENLAAAQDAFSKGGLDFVELTTTQRELIASRVAYLDARLALVDAWAELALVTGLDVKP